MKALKNAIETRGHYINDEVLKVDAFLNHQIDCSLVDEMGNEFYEHFKNKGITKVVTIESSGIAPAYATAIRLNVPLIFIKKTQPSTMIDPAFAEVFSFTKNKTYPICIEKEYLKKGDKVLFIDDFLANGEAFKGTENLIAQAIHSKNYLLALPYYHSLHVVQLQCKTIRLRLKKTRTSQNTQTNW